MARQLLAEIREDADLRSIPVVILTASRLHEDRIRGELLQVEGYMNKPVDLEKFIVVVKSIDTFWLSVVTLPPNGH